MTENRRIALNVAATYGRSLFTLACGLLTGRWVLLSLGQVDYGLFGLVGGLVSFVSFINNLFSGAISRYYAYYIGAAKKTGEGGGEECRKWFNTALVIHTAVPVVLMVVGYPIGLWAVRHYLTIPADRVLQCVWLWRFSCLSCFIGMLNVPFVSMYVAKQEIAEMTVYNVAATAANVCFGYYMVTHPGDWLVAYGAWATFVVACPQLLICMRAVRKYPECKVVFRYMLDLPRIREILAFAGGRFVCGLSLLLCYNGGAVLINKMLGPVRNAAVSVGNTVAGQCSTLAWSFSGAFTPVITNAAGAGDLVKMRKYMLATCSIGIAALLLFCLPLLLEMDYVLQLWLKSPPEWTLPICTCIIVANLFEVMATGLVHGIFAMGNIVKYQVVESLCWFSVLPVAGVLMLNHCDVLGYGIALILARIVAIWVKVHYAHRKCGVAARVWIMQVLVPSVAACGCSLAAGAVCVTCFAPSFLRLALTTAVVEAVFLPLAWRLLLPAEMKEKLVATAGVRIRSLRRVLTFA